MKGYKFRDSDLLNADVLSEKTFPRARRWCSSKMAIFCQGALTQDTIMLEFRVTSGIRYVAKIGEMCKFWESNEKGNPKIRYLVEKIMLKYLKIPAFVYFFKDCLISAFTRCGCFCWYTHTVSCINISITTWTLQSVWLDNLGFRHQDLVTA